MTVHCLGDFVLQKHVKSIALLSLTLVMKTQHACTSNLVPALACSDCFDLYSRLPFDYDHVPGCSHAYGRCASDG